MDNLLPHLTVAPARRPARPLLAYDGDCPFCRRTVRIARRLAGPAVEFHPYQAIAPRFPEIPLETFAASVRLIEPDGRVSSGAEAVWRTLADARRPPLGLPLRLYRRSEFFARLSERVYAHVARRRGDYGRWLGA